MNTNDGIGAFVVGIFFMSLIIAIFSTVGTYAYWVSITTFDYWPLLFPSVIIMIMSLLTMEILAK